MREGNILTKKEERKALLKRTITIPRIHLTERQLYDLEMILNGGFAPLSGFQNEDDYTSVVENMRLKGGGIWPIPIVFDVLESDNYKVGDEVALCNKHGTPLAVLRVESRYVPDKEKEALLVYGTTDTSHPGVYDLMNEVKEVYLGGRVHGLKLPEYFDHNDIRLTPKQTRKMIKEKGWSSVAGFQTRNPIHKAHFELIKGIHKENNIPILIHPVVGLTKKGDFDYRTRVRTYKIIHEKYAKDFAALSLLPLAMRMAGPREAVWHALIRKNYGCSHFIIGRDHAGPGKDKNGNPFYEANDAVELAESLEEELGIKILSSTELVYVENKKKYFPVDKVLKKEKVKKISGTDFRNMLREGKEVPEWFSFKECVDEFEKEVKKSNKRGFTLFLTGLSGSGKSTIADVLYDRLEAGDREVTLLDGDVIRQNLSKGLGFSKKDREINIERVGYVAGEITKHGGIAICSMIAPIDSTRKKNREKIEKEGTYVEVHVSTSLEVCEKRDVKGLYKKARKGLITQFTGVDDPYEEPENPEIKTNTVNMTPEESAETILDFLREHKLII